jgi:biopolymer transport protein ExbD
LPAGAVSRDAGRVGQCDASRGRRVVIERHEPVRAPRPPSGDTESMAFDLGSRRGARAAINITPLVDIVFVLLIIFMVIVPAKTRQIPVEVPPHLPPDTVVEQSPLIVRVEPDLGIVIEDRGETQRVGAVELALALRPRLDRVGASSAVLLDIAEPVAWRDAIGVMDTIRGLGTADRPTTIALVTRP